MENRRLVDYQLRPDRDLTILIPARAGSKRCPGKNTRMLGGKPLFLWSIEAAKAANVARIIVSTDDAGIGGAVLDLGDVTAHFRKPEHATDGASDFSWVYDLKDEIRTDYFAILRPTSPFRTASTIRRAFAMLVGSKAHSVRAVERVTAPHPAKMWEFIPGSSYMRPIQQGSYGGTPWHSLPTQALPPVYKQNSSIEVAQTWVIEGTKAISGYHIAPFLTEALEGFAIDTEADFAEAERLVQRFYDEVIGGMAIPDDGAYGHGV